MIDSDLRRDVGEVALRAGEHDVHFSGGIALDAVEPVLLDEFRRHGVAGTDGAAFDGRHILVRMETKHHQVAEAADGFVRIARADGMRGIFHDPQSMLRRQSVKVFHIHRQSGEMHRHDGARSSRDGGGHPIQIDVAGGQFDVDENRLGAQPCHHIGAGGETHCRDDHFVPGTHARDFEGHFEAGRGRRHHPHVAFTAEVRRERALESRDLGPARQLTRAKHIGNGRDARLIDGGTRKGKKGLQAGLLETRITPAQINAMPSTLPGAMLSPSHSTETAATTTYPKDSIG